MWHRRILSILYLGYLLGGCVVTSKTNQASSSPHLVQYDQAMVRYEAMDYYGTSKLLDEAIPLLRGKKEAVLAHFYRAYSNFYQAAYQRSALDFKYFYETYPSTPQVEEALYMQGYALYRCSPDVRLDQQNTEKAIQTLETYLRSYPQGIYEDRATRHLRKLRDKLALKAFNNAKLYHRFSHYQAAVIALTNFQQDFPDTPLNEKAAYLKTDAQYKFAQEAKIPTKQASRLRTALVYCHHFLDQYPHSRYKQAIAKIYKNTLAQIDKLTNS